MPLKTLNCEVGEIAQTGVHALHTEIPGSIPSTAWFLMALQAPGGVKFKYSSKRRSPMSTASCGPESKIIIATIIFIIIMPVETKLNRT